MHDFGPTYVLSFEIKMMVICWFFVLCVRHQKVLIRLNSFTLLREPKSLIPVHQHGTSYLLCCVSVCGQLSWLVNRLF